VLFSTRRALAIAVCTPSDAGAGQITDDTPPDPRIGKVPVASVYSLPVCLLCCASSSTDWALGRGKNDQQCPLAGLQSDQRRMMW